METIALLAALSTVAIAFWFLLRLYWKPREPNAQIEEIELEDRTQFAQGLFY